MQFTDTYRVRKEADGTTYTACYYTTQPYTWGISDVKGHSYKLIQIREEAVKADYIVVYGGPFNLERISLGEAL